MPKQNDTDRCFLIRCKGKVTYHEKLSINQETGQVTASGMVGGRPDANYSGWLCDTCGEAFWHKP